MSGRSVSRSTEGGLLSSRSSPLQRQLWTINLNAVVSFSGIGRMYGCNGGGGGGLLMATAISAWPALAPSR